MSLHRQYSFLFVILVVALAVIHSPLQAECDLEAPLLTGFDISPLALDTALDSVDVTCEMSFTDAPGGVDNATCVLTPSIFFTQFRTCVAEQPSSGTRRNGTFTCTMTIPRYSIAGTWLASVLVADTVGNEREVSNGELQTAGYPNVLTVTSAFDLSAPVLTDFDFDPKTSNVSAGPQDVVCSVTLQDPLAGVEDVTCGFFTPSLMQGQTCFAFEPSSGTRQDGTFTCTLTIPQYADDATWTAYVIARDRVANQAAADAATLQSLGFPAELVVVSTPEDFQSPQLTLLEFSPQAIDVSSQSQVVDCEVTVTDSPAGVFGVSCQFTSPSGLVNHGCFSAAPFSGTPQNGTFRCGVLIPRYSAPGVWKVDLGAIDNVPNIPLSLDAAALALLGMPTDLTVTCDAEAEPFVEFETGSALVWNAISGASRYNVYRGDLAGFVDGNADGQPDGGYGACRNGSDPDLTDTLYVDAENPELGAGFSYLVSYGGPGDESGLGSSSAGAARTVSSPCP